MIHTEDQASLQRMLGVPELPANVQAEYALRRTLFSKALGVGPMGAVALVDLLRHLDFAPQVTAPKPEKVDFTKVKRGTRIEAKFGGGWQGGIYVRMVSHGMIEILLDGDTMHRECRNGPDILRLEQKSDTVTQSSVPEVITDVRLNEANELVVEKVPVTECPPAAHAATDVPPAPSLSGEVTKAHLGKPVWVEVDNETKEGVLVKFLKKDKVLVTVEDEDTPSEVELSRVRPAA